MPIHTVTIGAGESIWVPKTATILAVNATDGLTLSGSDCIDTSVPPSKCWQFVWETYNPVPTELSGSVFTGIEIDGVTYEFDSGEILNYNAPTDIDTEIARVCTFSTIVSINVATDPATLVITLPDSMGRPMLLYKNNTETVGVFEYGALLGQEITCP